MPQAQQLGRYHLLDRIAFGGMAEIFRAKTFDREGHAHLVAVKRVLAHLIEDQDFLQMLVDEAKITALLRHDNIARVYEFSKAGDEYFLAMEYVDGKDLRALLERGRHAGRPLPPEHAAWIAMETAQALHAAHIQRDGAGRALRIVHRDVSPSNVLCSYHGEVKLCDFGIAKATLTRVQTKTGVIKGKVKYMSPEQAMGRKLDHRSDLFSLGSVLYEMLTLQPPFVAPTEVELIFAVRDARKAAVRTLSPDVPDDLARIVDKSMTRSRQNRYQSGEQMALDLRIFLDRYAPGYRRSHFSRYLRQVFEVEIDKELRQLENYVIAGADSGMTGVNLIADVLGPDAPFTQFTPVFGSEAGVTQDRTGHFPQLDPVRPSDLHGQPTMMLDRARLGLAPVVAEIPPSSLVPTVVPRISLHEQATELQGERLGGRLREVPLDSAYPDPRPPLRSIHDEETGEKLLPEARGNGPAAAPAHRARDTARNAPLEEGAGSGDPPPPLGLPDLGDEPEGSGPPNLHAQATMILGNPLLGVAPAPFDAPALASPGVAHSLDFSPEISLGDPEPSQDLSAPGGSAAAREDSVTGRASELPTDDDPEVIGDDDLEPIEG